MVRIGGYLEPVEHDSLKAYVNGLGITFSSLASLLIHRELKHKRLPSLTIKYTKTVSSSTRRRVTTRLLDDELKLRLSDLAENAGLPIDHAVSILVRTELDERWLENAM